MTEYGHDDDLAPNSQPSGNGLAAGMKRTQKWRERQEGQKELSSFMPFLPFWLHFDRSTTPFARLSAQVEIYS
jgi:hypothetical protein